MGCSKFCTISMDPSDQWCAQRVCIGSVIDRLQNWTVDMQMRFHSEKCRTMNLGKHNPNTKYTLSTDDGTLHEISQTAEEKD